MEGVKKFGEDDGGKAGKAGQVSAAMVLVEHPLLRCIKVQ